MGVDSKFSFATQGRRERVSRCANKQTRRHSAQRALHIAMRHASTESRYGGLTRAAMLQTLHAITASARTAFCTCPCPLLES